MNVPSSMQSNPEYGEVTRNIGSILLKNRELYSDNPAFAERENGVYRYWNWKNLTDDILLFSSFLLSQGFSKEDRIAIITQNSYKRLVAELAVMSSGLTSVPIFIGYSKDRMTELLEFSKVKMLIAENEQILNKISPAVLPLLVLTLNQVGEILTSKNKRGTSENISQETLFRAVEPQTLSVIMYTSGTTGFPKGVQLSHANLMSQQAALEMLWKPEPGMRFLCYLPWHHSFGGLFERFFALHSGGCLAIDDSWGKNVDQLLKNFSEIKPHIYFSVPKIYQEIVARILASKEIEKTFFHQDLRFIFTAAAPLPINISNIFKDHQIPVIEGWGLTETSPCCTLTEQSTARKTGVVGFALPGVEIRLGEENEIEVKGPNVMSGYFDNSDATTKALNSEGWFKTGDIGEITDDGLKIVSRKDLMFKLSNGEKVFPTQIEERIKANCKFIKHAYVFGKGEPTPYLLLFPNLELLEASSKGNVIAKDCQNPESSDQFSNCLGDCLDQINHQCAARFERVARAVVIDSDLTIEGNELTPSFKLVPQEIEKKYNLCISALKENRLDLLPQGVYVVNIANKKAPS